MSIGNRIQNHIIKSFGKECDPYGQPSIYRLLDASSTLIVSYNALTTSWKKIKITFDNFIVKLSSYI